MGREQRVNEADDRERDLLRIRVLHQTYRVRMCRDLTADEKDLMCLRGRRLGAGDELPVDELRAWAEDARDDARPGIAETAHAMLRRLDDLERPLP